MKTCTACKKEKPLNEFSSLRRSKDGKNGRCKLCLKTQRREWGTANREKLNSKQLSRYHASGRASQLKFVYGISPDDYEKMSKAQNGLCKLCGSGPQGKSKYLDIDHCHLTGKIRGLLCRKCNTAIGLFKENVLVLEKAIIYLGEINDLSD